VGEERAEAPVLTFAAQREWERWLDEHHADADAVWLKLAKKGTGIESVTYAEALEIALCFGWIDGQSRGLDESWSLQRFTPRRKRSSWSRINRDHAMRLIREGRMRPPGLAEVERAKADGRWDAAYEPQSTATVPDDLERELDARPAARAFFESLDSRNRYAILHRLGAARKPETRARRLAEFVAMLETRRKVYP
jgi:uncharacterized protein YdeI (YjbR/CyaY-like superfamily)